jgi:hypothetical protein
MTASPADVAEMLAWLERALGSARLLARCETDVLETVYIERQDGGVAAHDLGGTWFYIVGHPAEYAPWSDDLVERLSAARNVSVVREQQEGQLIGLRLQREMLATDDPKEVVTSMAELLDAIFRGHKLGGGLCVDVEEPLD